MGDKVLAEGAFTKVRTNQLARLPIIILNSDKDETLKSEMVKLVDQLLKLSEEKESLKLQTKIDQIKSKIDYCENRINEIVFQLYDLTADEIKIIVGK